jgi:ribosomal protein L11 methylase PrmA
LGNNISEQNRHPASFRDPDGYVYYQGDSILRYICSGYLETYNSCVSSGFFQTLFDKSILIYHEEIERGDDHVIIKPERIDFCSYPYEWCFSQWKDAALLTLSLQKIALEFGFTLKDASAFNVQFHKGRPVFIDTLSFEPYIEGNAWGAYRQFCEHFLAPLALMALKDIRLGTLFRIFIHGIPLDLAVSLLPIQARFNPNLLAHLYLHASSQKRLENRPGDAPARADIAISRKSLQGILESLEMAIRSLSWKPAGTEWGDYYDKTNYTDAALLTKRELVAEFLSKVTPAPQMVWDCGGNTGFFSRVASEQGILTLCLDIDPAAVEQNYHQVRTKGETFLLPLLQDFTNPSADRGWNQEERTSLLGRKSADATFALALIHHLVIGNNVPLVKVSEFFIQISPWLIIEFVPKEDSQVKRLLAHRKDIFPDYNEQGFEKAFSAHWKQVDKVLIPGTKRILYLFSRKSGE